MDDDALRQLPGRGRRRAASAVADVDLDHHFDRAARCRDRRRQPLDPVDRIDRDRQPHPPRQRRDTRQLGRVDDLVRDVDVGDAGIGERLGLARLLDAHADRAGCHLQPCDRGTLVHLGVRPEADAVVARECRHCREVSLHRIEVDHERRRVDRGDRIAGTWRRAHDVTRGTVGQSPSLASSRVVPSRCAVSLQPTSVKRSPV
jgi:hypothetical protein